VIGDVIGDWKGDGSVERDNDNGDTGADILSGAIEKYQYCASYSE